MEAIEKLKDLIFPKLMELGFEPICCYYGGSFLNGTWNKLKSDIDVIVVINLEEPYCHFSMKLVLGNLEYSLLFNSLHEYEKKVNMRELPNSRLYGYLNSFSLAGSAIAISDKWQKKVIDNICFYLKNNAKIAADELIKRELNIHHPRKEDYHLLRAINISERFVHKIPPNDILDCKNGKVPLEFVLKREGIL